MRNSARTIAHPMLERSLMAPLAVRKFFHRASGRVRSGMPESPRPHTLRDHPIRIPAFIAGDAKARISQRDKKPFNEFAGGLEQAICSIAICSAGLRVA